VSLGGFGRVQVPVIELPNQNSYATIKLDKFDKFYRHQYQIIDKKEATPLDNHESC
jgi:hypothetical protein